MTEPIEDKPNRLQRMYNATKSRPFLTALIVLLMVVTPGFVMIENQGDETNEVADTAAALAAKVAETEAKEDAKQAREAIEGCQVRNTFQQNTRVKFDKLFDSIELVLISGSPDDPARIQRIKDFVNQLRASVETKPEDEDRDCDQDGQLNESDYLP